MTREAGEGQHLSRLPLFLPSGKVQGVGVTVSRAEERNLPLCTGAQCEAPIRVVPVLKRCTGIEIKTMKLHPPRSAT